MSHLAIYLLGSPRVELDDEEVRIPRRKATALLAYLAVSGQIHQRDSLAALLWPEYDQSSARAELRRMLSALNRVLGAGWLVADREVAALQADACRGGSRPGGYLRRTAPTADSQGAAPDQPIWVDVRAFRGCLAACEAHDHPRGHACRDCVALLEKAAALYRDDFLAGFTLPDSAAFDEWQRFQAQSLRDELAAVLEQLATSYGERGEHDRAIVHARRWLSLDPLHEPAHRALMRLYVGSGRRAAALRQYRQCVRTLEGELGLPPAAETTALYERIRAERPPHVPRRPAEVLPAAGPLPAFLTADEEAEPERPVFVSREPELAQLQRYLEAALMGRGGVAFVTGGAGRGKTALMAEFARRATEAQPELLVAWGSCNAYAGLGDPYLPFREILNALTGDVEGRWAASTVTREQARRLWQAMPAAVEALLAHGEALFDTFVSARALFARAEAAAPAHAPWMPRLKECVEGQRVAAGNLAPDQLLAQVTGVLRALAVERPLLLCLDDLQWVDAASAALVLHFGRHLQGSRILIVAAYRPDEVALGRGGERHPLEQVVGELKRQYGDVWIDLRQADEREGRQFVDAFLDSQPNRLGESFRAALYAHTGGHPLFTVELLRAMQARADLVQGEQGRWVEGVALHWERLPARIGAVIETRVERLSPELRELLAVASVEGEAFTAQVAAHVQGMSERQVLYALSRELQRRHQLVTEEGIVPVDGRRLARYRFAHALYQQHVYNNLGQGERGLLHGEVAEALETLYVGHTDDIIPQLAHHYAEAGDSEKALHYLLQAGDRARLAYAHQEAIAHYERAVALQKEAGDDEGAGRTLMKLGLAYHTRFDFARAHAAFEEGFVRWQRGGDRARRTALPPAPHALRIAWSDPYTLDPALCSEAVNYMVIEQIFRGPIWFGPDLGLVPELAQSWEVLDGGHRYLFHLRRDARWSDGVPVTAHDVEYAWKRALAPSASSVAAQSLSAVVGVQASSQQESSGPADLGIQALDDCTLEVELCEASSYFAYRLRAMGAVPRHVVEAHGAAWTDLDKIVTNGPFRPAEWEKGKRMLLVRNPVYHGPFRGNVEQVELRLDPDLALALSWYREGSLDILPLGGSMPETDRARREFAGEFVSLPVLRTWYLAFDVSRPPFDDPRVRRAFALAADRERLAQVDLRGLESPATGGLVPPGMPGHSPEIGLPYDPDEARRLLSQAGYAQGFGFPALDALVPSGISASPRHLQAQWREQLGIEVTWEVLDLSQFPRRFHQDPPHLYLSGWVADWPDPSNFLEESLVCESTRWMNTAYQALLRRAQHSTDQEQRLHLLQRADQILVQEAPVVPLIYGRQYGLVKPWIRGFRLSALLNWY
ncbi:MAG: ABC transporter substrate-binding protein, partial [Anaerolineae bacterium]